MRTSRAWAWLQGRDVRHARRREGAGVGDAGAPARAPAGGRARGGRGGARCCSAPSVAVPLSPRLMATTGRVPLLVLLGIGALVRPAVRRHPLAGWSRSLLLVAWTCCSPRAPAPSRSPGDRSAQVRQGETTPADLLVPNTGRRRVRGVLRDAWQPSAGAHGNRHRLDLAAGDQVRLTTPLTPTRRGDRRAGPGHGPLHRAAGARRPAALPGGAGTRAGAAAVPLPQAPAEPAGAAPRARRPGRGAGARPGDGVRLAARVRPRRRRTQHRLAGQRAHPRRRWCGPGSPSGTAGCCWCSTPPAPRRGASTTCPGWTPRWTPRCCWPRSPPAPGTRVDFVAGDRRVRARVRGGGRTRRAAAAGRRDGRPGAGHRRGGLVAAQRRGRRARPAAGARGAADRPGAGRGRARPAAGAAGPRPPAPGGGGLGARPRARADGRAAATTPPRCTTRRRPSRCWPTGPGPPTCSAALGVDVVDADAERLPVALTDHYLMLKGRGCCSDWSGGGGDPRPRAASSARSPVCPGADGRRPRHEHVGQEHRLGDHADPDACPGRQPRRGHEGLDDAADEQHQHQPERDGGRGPALVRERLARGSRRPGSTQDQNSRSPTPAATNTAVSSSRPCGRIRPKNSAPRSCWIISAPITATLRDVAEQQPDHGQPEHPEGDAERRDPGVVGPHLGGEVRGGVLAVVALEVDVDEPVGLPGRDQRRLHAGVLQQPRIITAATPTLTAIVVIHQRRCGRARPGTSPVRNRPRRATTSCGCPSCGCGPGRAAREVGDQARRPGPRSGPPTGGWRPPGSRRRARRPRRRSADGAC